jgi:SAM-dependent methyltransferase
MAERVVQADLAFQSNLYESRDPVRRWLHSTRRDWVQRRLVETARQITRRYERTRTDSMHPAYPCFLDVGVGCGVYSRLMVQAGMQTVSMDVNPKFVEAAARSMPVTAIHGDICDPTVFSNRAFADLAVCTEVLEHVPDPAAALAHISQALKPGGILVLTTPQKWSTTEIVARLLDFAPVRWLAQAIYREPVDALGHISRMTAGELKDLLERSGFYVLEHARFGMYLPAVAEFGGVRGLRLLQALQDRAQRSRLFGWTLWTQSYVLLNVGPGRAPGR